MKVQNNSPIINYVGHQLKLDGFFSEPLVDVIRKDNTDDECVNLLSVDCKDLIVDYLDNYFDDDLPVSCAEDYVKSKLSRIADNLKVFETKDGVVFTQFRSYCPHCGSKHVVEDGYYPKKLVLNVFGNVDARIKRYECRNCGKGFSADISSVVDRKFSVSKRIMKIIQNYYAICGTPVRRIQEIMKRIHNVCVSYQEVQDIIVDYIIKYESNLETYSGYYVFDSLWVKIDEISDNYVYFFALFDVHHRTLVDYKIVEEENSTEVYNFLRNATLNQPRKAITTDLHIAYRKPIQDLGFKHQFCEFHTKQNINKYLYNHVKENNISKKTHKEYKKYLEEIYQIYESNNRFEVLDILDNLSGRREEFPDVINEIIDKKIRPYSRYLTMFLEDSFIERTSNWIERIFGDLAPKSLKNKFKTLRGFLSRLNLKLERWDSRNAFL
ncbi:hypothetical protein PXD04_10455 [Methanosphaera sp. ISO3-F5]|uniref:hypothetical protein n=1 Tax=Methanosphaera sp. ISO3-F5 TaxID=1452353 RepID=UPI002B25C1B7|nr:hypothetical protein [Methanosphaera sp. ISO3-F5]WQH64112.1 hypothetical protein PXD04_10455 [Methanosphaera sp. ISO3-F5]